MFIGMCIIDNVFLDSGAVRPEAFCYKRSERSNLLILYVKEFVLMILSLFWHEAPIDATW